MEISEKQLRSMVDDVDELHRESMKTFREENGELLFGELSKKTGPTRRRFLTGAGLGGVALTVGQSLVPMSRLVAPAYGQAPSDEELAIFAASFEFAAVQAYTAAAGTGKVTTRAVAEAAQKFAGHHNEHGMAFAGFAGADVEPNQAILDEFGPQIAGAPDEDAILEIAFTIENAAASTYLFGLGVLQDPDAFNTAASILPVESQHAITLGLALGREVTDEDLMPAFEPQDKALDPAQFPVNQ
ncbi:MAG: ferritin-like domain-containing protein [Acidimicrobiales bacterium]